MLVFQSHDIINIFRGIDNILKEKSFTNMVKSCMSKSDLFKNFLKKFFLETSNSHYHEIILQFDIAQIR